MEPLDRRDMCPAGPVSPMSRMGPPRGPRLSAILERLVGRRKTGSAARYSGSDATKKERRPRRKKAQPPRRFRWVLCYERADPDKPRPPSASYSSNFVDSST